MSQNRGRLGVSTVRAKISALKIEENNGGQAARGVLRGALVIEAAGPRHTAEVPHTRWRRLAST